MLINLITRIFLIIKNNLKSNFLHIKDKNNLKIKNYYFCITQNLLDFLINHK